MRARLDYDLADPDDLDSLFDVEDETILMLEERLNAANRLIALYESEREMRHGMTAVTLIVFCAAGLTVGAGFGLLLALWLR